MADEYDRDLDDDLNDVASAPKQAIDDAKRIKNTVDDVRDLSDRLKGRNEQDTPSEADEPSTEQEAPTESQEPSAGNTPTGASMSEPETVASEAGVPTSAANTGSASEAAAAGDDAAEMALASSMPNPTGTEAGAFGGAPGAGAAAGGEAAGATAGVAAGGEAAGAAAAGGEAAAGAAAGEAAGAAAAGAAAGESAAVGGAMAAATAAAPETLGLSYVAAAAVAAATAGVNVVKKEVSDIENGEDESSGGSCGCCIFGLAAPLLLLALGALLIAEPIIWIYNKAVAIADGVGAAWESFTDNDKATFFENVFGSDYNGDMYASVREANAIDENSAIYYIDIIDAAMENSILVVAKDNMTTSDKVEHFIEGVLGFDLFDDSAALTAFYEARFPYSTDPDLSIGDVKDLVDSLQSAGGNYYQNSEYKACFDDVNYAEILSVFCQSDDLTEDMSYSSFYDFMVSDDVAEVLLEMEFNEEVETGTWEETDTDALEEELADGLASGAAGALRELDNAQIQNNEAQAAGSSSTSTTKTKGYVSATVYPYGLRELYGVMEVNPLDIYSRNENFMNYEMLDYNEQYLRTRLPDVDLGPSCSEERSRSSMVYDILNNCINYPDSSNLDTSEIMFSTYNDYSYPTGRSAYCYTESDICDLEQDGASEWRYVNNTLGLPNVPDGVSVILDMYQYINQGDYPNVIRGTDGKGDSVKTSGCTDCSYAMCAAYYLRTNMDMAVISPTYVVNNSFQGPAFLSVYGLSQTYSNSFNMQYIVDAITVGKPVVIQIRGYWVYRGVTYHGTENGHFLVICGYDDTGFYVKDPGRRANDHIPFEAFQYVRTESMRVINGDNVYYSVNTVAEGTNTSEWFNEDGTSTDTGTLDTSTDDSASTDDSTSSYDSVEVWNKEQNKSPTPAFTDKETLDAMKKALEEAQEKAKLWNSN